jgi:hypothetical protein
MIISIFCQNHFSFNFIYVHHIYMSLATLKKKTHTKYNNMSSNTKSGFSLNGNHRNQGYVGQDSLSRHYIRTVSYNNAPHGYGGCCGTYDKSKILYPSNTICFNDSTVVKSSVMNTSGLFSERETNSHDCLIVKADDHHHNASQNQYIETKRDRKMFHADDPSCSHTITTPNPCKQPKSSFSLIKKPCVLKQSSPSFGNSSSYFTKKLISKCSANKDIHYHFSRKTIGSSSIC